MGMARTGCHPTSHRQPHWRSRENRQNEPVSVSDKATDKQKSVIGVASVSALSKILLCSYIYDGWESEPTIYKKARALHSCTCTCTCTCTYILEAVWRGELFKKGPLFFFSPAETSTICVVSQDSTEKSLVRSSPHGRGTVPPPDRMACFSSPVAVPGVATRLTHRFVLLSPLRRACAERPVVVCVTHVVRL